MVNGIRDELIDIKLQNNNLNQEQKYILEHKIAGNDCENPYKESEEVYNTLLNTPTREDGGRHAIFGFYYQFLVAIDYFIELAEGKWDFMAFEIHDDIVLCKEKEKQSIVRFVQVKTSNSPVQNYTSTKLCNRTKKEISSNNYLINDSWLDKMYLNAKIFKNNPEVIQQFQLVTNFSFHVSIPKDSKTKNIQHYRENKDFSNIDIKDDDPFFKKIKEPVFNNQGASYNYKTETGMTVEELLSSTQILEQNDHLSSYRDGIRARLGDMISKKIKTEAGATIADDDINWLIGEMIASCAERDDKLVLFIDEKKAEELENKIFERSIEYSDKFGEMVGNKKHVDSAIERVSQEILTSNPKYFKDIEQIIISIKNQFYDWIDEGGTISHLVSRFSEGHEESLSFHGKMHESKRKESVFAFTKMFLLLNLVNDKVIFSSKHRSILAKEVINSIEKYYLSLLKIEDNYHYSDVIEKLEEIITRLHINAPTDLLLMSTGKSNKIVIEGIHDTFDTIDFRGSKMARVSINKPKVESIDDNTESMTKVEYEFLLIPWYALDSKYKRLTIDDDEFSKFKDELIKCWKTLNQVGE